MNGFFGYDRGVFTLPGGFSSFHVLRASGGYKLEEGRDLGSYCEVAL